MSGEVQRQFVYPSQGSQGLLHAVAPNNIVSLKARPYRQRAPRDFRQQAQSVQLVRAVGNLAPTLVDPAKVDRAPASPQIDRSSVRVTAAPGDVRILSFRMMGAPNSQVEVSVTTSASVMIDKDRGGIPTYKPDVFRILQVQIGPDGKSAPQVVDISAIHGPAIYLGVHPDDKRAEPIQLTSFLDPGFLHVACGGANPCRMESSYGGVTSGQIAEVPGLLRGLRSFVRRFFLEN